MGNSLMGRDVLSKADGAPIHAFYSSAAWIEGRAEDQLKQLATLDGVQQLAAFPDLHPGKYGPVGCAVLADRLYPALAGGDIGCGMTLYDLNLKASHIKLNKAERQLRRIGEASTIDHTGRLKAEGLPGDLWPTALGTIGGGNHFCELQVCCDASANSGLEKGSVYLLVHSGSRGLGGAILAHYLADGNVDLQGAEAETYLQHHDKAVHWARLNRQIIAERVADALKAEIRLIVDNAHNLVARDQGGYLHRKGAAMAGGLVPLAGSRSTNSYLIDTADCPQTALSSCAHGSGRKYDRHSMHGRISAKKSSINALSRNAFGGRVICEDPSLLIEEAPLAYKSSADVLADLEAAAIARRVATLQPLITFKKIKQEKSR